MPKTFHSQYRECRKADMIGFNEGPEEKVETLIPKGKFLKALRNGGNGDVTIKLSVCRRFGGICSSQNPGCVEMREKS